MSVATNEFAQPASSDEFDFPDPQRYDDVESKQRRIAEFLAQKRYDALLLRTPANFAWLTSGAVGPRRGGETPAAALFITPDARVVATNNVDATQLFDKQLGGLGFQLKQRPWHEDPQILLGDLCRGRKVASDVCDPMTVLEEGALSSLRLPLTSVECARLRELGGLVAHAVEATARHVMAGQTEQEIAGELAHRLVRHEVEPVWLRAVADGRGGQYRHWTASPSPLVRWCLIGAIGRRHGLCCGCMRTVVLGSPPEGLISTYQQASMLAATGMFFSQAGNRLATVWQKLHRIYEKQGLSDEWQLADQADVIGYQPSEVTLVPASDFELRPGMALHWHPSVGPVQTGDTVLVHQQGEHLLTKPVDWPMVTITVKGRAMQLPDLLIREAGSSSSDLP
ncbi:MAG: M24 family metallopeptidase [Planctomycetaceae bacterium]|nr:M24 family metallopeptidase [Planctomycetaceae bacterium]